MKEKFRSLPVFFLSRWMLLWAGVVPQIMLAALNLRSWWLVKGEVSPQQLRQWTWLAAFEVALLLVNLGWFLYLAARRRAVSWKMCLPLFVAHIGYFWTLVSMMDTLLPDAVTIWILPPHVFLFHQFMLMMPAVFFCAFRLACFPMTKRPAADFGITIGALVGMPLAWYVFVRFLTFRAFFDLPGFVWALFWIVATVLAVMAFLRLMMMLYAWTRRMQSHRWILLLLAGLVMPIGGMALNTTIPFPVDLQYTPIYMFLVLNAVALLLPRPTKVSALLWVWLARCATFSFTLYFFLLFLPFLPLALPAMFAAGAGFLIMAPTFLFAVHVQVLVDEGKALAARFGGWRALVYGLAALAVIPACLLGDALLDRRSLMGAVDAVYSPDTTRSVPVPARRAARILERLDAAKKGLYLPFVSGVYRKVVFDGMVLPDHKIAAMYRLFTGQELVGADATVHRRDSIDFWTGWRGTTRSGQVRPPPRTARLTETSVTRVVSNGMVRASLALTLTNTNRPQAEYVGRIELSPGVLVTGYWLDVEGVRKPGRLFEKRAAMWVYHMIRDMTRRDPGLLIFEEPHRLKLNVFPFAVNETRRTGIEFLFPEGLDATLTVDGREMALAPDAETAVQDVLVVEGDDGTTAVVWPPAVGLLEPGVLRKPCFHIMVEQSQATADISAEEWQKRLDAVAARVPDDAVFHVAAVNFTTTYLTFEPVELAGARRLLSVELENVEAEGGLEPHQGVRHGVARWQALAVDVRKTRVPVFVFMVSPDTEQQPIGSLAGLETLLPDAPAYYVDAGGLSRVAYGAGASSGVDRIERPGEIYFPVQGKADAVSPDAPSVFPAEPGAAFSLPLERCPRSADADRYVTGIRLWERWRSSVVNPSLLDPQYGELVAESRRASVMLPVTSFMVVENTAQEEMLERKHREGADADSALEFDEFQESPEPAFWWLLLPLLAIEAGRRGLSQRRGGRRGAERCSG